MNYKTKIINPIIEQNEWEKISSKKINNIFLSLSWIKTLVDTYKYVPYFFIQYNNKTISSIIPLLEVNSYLTGKRAVSLPFTDFCNPYSVDSDCFWLLFNEIINFGKSQKWKSIELRGGGEFLKKNICEKQYYIHTLDLHQDIDQIFKQLKGNVRRNIKKARKWDVDIKIAQDIAGRQNFIRLNSITRKRHGLPCQPRSFFLNLFNLIIDKKEGYIFQAQFQNKTIASAVFLRNQDKVIYKYGASDKKYQYLRANDLLIWKAIEYFNQNQYSELSFGRTHPDNLGLLQFKSGWTNNIEKCFYYKYDLEKDEFVNNKNQQRSFVHSIFRLLPIYVLELLGKVLYKHFG
ncbi:MAG: peptidoglycan bridge formation glycyltransferase FemA/FemB family protein [Spirochaetes bacterium]|nr:peptidoglycan bridge formation glycyltransferase FemA/FemB family protein [Spirochaetota bacterium]